MSGTNIGGPNFNRDPADNEIKSWMWWRWEYRVETGTWEIMERLESPHEDTPGLIYHIPTAMEREPPLTYEWWWIPHVRDEWTELITTFGKMHVRDRSKQSFAPGQPENTQYGEWAEISLRENVDSSNRGPRGFCIWAGHGVPAQNLVIEPAPDLPYEGDVFEIFGDFYIDLDVCWLYGPRYVNDQDQATWGVGRSILGPPWAEYEGVWVSGNAYTATAPTPYDNTIGKHSIVTHTPFNSNIIQSFICVQDIEEYTTVVPETVNSWHMVGGSHDAIFGFDMRPLQIGLEGNGAWSRDNVIYIKTGGTNEDHYWFELVPQHNDSNTDGNWTWGMYATSGNLAPPSGFTTYGTTYDPEDDTHRWIQVYMGGDEHSKFRFWIDDAQGGAWGIDLDTIYHTSEDETYRNYAWVDTVTHGDVHGLGMHDGTSRYAVQMDAECIQHAVYWCMRTLNDDYLNNNNAWLMDFQIVSAQEVTVGNSGLSTSSDLRLHSRHTGAGEAPTFIFSTEDMYDHEGDCDGGNDTGDAEKTTSSADRFLDSCDGKQYTRHYLSAGIADDKEPFHGSSYWDVVQ